MWIKKNASNRSTLCNGCLSYFARFVRYMIFFYFERGPIEFKHKKLKKLRGCFYIMFNCFDYPVKYAEWLLKMVELKKSAIIFYSLCLFISVSTSIRSVFWIVCVWIEFVFTFGWYYIIIQSLCVQQEFKQVYKLILSVAGSCIMNNC